MPILDLDRPLYVRRERMYVDNIARNLLDSRNQFDIVMDCPKRYQNIQSIEVVNYNIPVDMAATFYLKSGTQNGNNLLDIELINDAGTQTLAFTVDITAPVSYEDKGTMATDIQTQIQDQMDALLDPYFTSPQVTWLVELTGPSNDIMKFTVNTTYPATTIFATFLFGTGPNKNDSPAQVFGFVPGQDTTTMASWTGPISNVPGHTAPFAYHRLQLQPLKYTDLTCLQIQPSLSREVPLARMFITNRAEWAQSEETTPRPRLYKEPLKYADKLNFKLLLQGNNLPASVSTNGWDVTIDLLNLSDETCVPGWVVQRLQYP